MRAKLLAKVCNYFEKKGGYDLAAKTAVIGSVFEGKFSDSRAMILKYAASQYHNEALRPENPDSLRDYFKKGVYFEKAGDKYLKIGDFDGAVTEFENAEHSFHFAGAKASEITGLPGRDKWRSINVTLCQLFRVNVQDKLKVVEKGKEYLIENGLEGGNMSVKLSYH